MIITFRSFFTKTVTLILILTFAIAPSPTSAQAQGNNAEIDVEAKDVEYDLPYPGVLPDNPLYGLKVIRDNFWLFFTRDYINKANLLLLHSDKKVSMSQQLADKGKWEIGSETLVEAEEDFNDMIEALEKSKEQGVSPEGDFILTIKLSNEKHREVIEDLLSQTPQGNRLLLENALEINKSTQERLQEL